MNPPINRSEASLAPFLVDRWHRAKLEAAAAGLSVDIFEGFRTVERQNYLYSLGRLVPGKIVTNAKPYESWHCFGLAIDVTFDGELSKPGFQHSWNGDYKKLSKIMVAHGFEWSGKWNKLTGGLSGELCHFQMTGGFTVTDARIWLQHGVKLPEIWAAVGRAVLG